VITEDAGLGTGWVPRELRHTFVSLPARGVPAEAIALLTGHNQVSITELVYRHQSVPALARGAEIMDQISDRGPRFWWPGEPKMVSNIPDIDTHRRWCWCARVLY
jgi:hypothetical protein